MFGTTDRLKKNLQTEIAAVLAFSASREQRQGGLHLLLRPDREIHPPKKGRSHILAIIRELVGFEPQSRGTRISEALRFLTNVTKNTARPSCSDFLDPGKDRTALEDALKIASGKHDLVGIRVSDPREAELLPDVGIIEMKDAETGRKAWVDTSSAGCGALRPRSGSGAPPSSRRSNTTASTRPRYRPTGITSWNSSNYSNSDEVDPKQPGINLLPVRTQRRYSTVRRRRAAKCRANTSSRKRCPSACGLRVVRKAGRTSITKRVKTVLAIALLTGLTTVLHAAPPTITARVEPDSIGIGDRFDVVIDVDRDLVQVGISHLQPASAERTEVVESHPVDTSGVTDAT